MEAAAPAPITKLLDCHGAEYVALALKLGLTPGAVATLVPSREAASMGAQVTGSRRARPDDLRPAARPVAQGAAEVSIARGYPPDAAAVTAASTPPINAPVRRHLGGPVS